MKPKRADLMPSDVPRLMLETGCSENTVRKWAKGGDVRQATNMRLSRAAVKVGIGVVA